MKIFRWLGALAALLVILAVAAIAYVYLSTQAMIDRTYDVALAGIAVPAGPADIAEGRRLATVRGCYDGCHGEGLQGAVFMDEPWLGRLVAPNLTQVAATHSDEDLERVIRHGVRQDGKSVWGMPATMFYHLSNADLGRIIAFIRSMPRSEGPATEASIGPLWRRKLMQDRWLPYAEEIRRDAPWIKGELAPASRNLGRYLAITVCTECHGMDLHGADDGTAPNLVIVMAYPRAAFVRLMREGVPMGGQQLGLMGLVARTRFAALTDEEVAALYDYLHSLGQQEAG